MNYTGKYRYLIYIPSTLFIIAIVWFTQYYLPKHRKVPGPPKEITGTGIIKNIQFIPKHEETVTYTTYKGTGRYRVPVRHSRSYNVPDNYSINIYLKEMNGEEKYQCFNLQKGKTFNINEQVKVTYKEEDAILKTIIVILNIEKI